MEGTQAVPNMPLARPAAEPIKDIAEDVADATTTAHDDTPQTTSDGTGSPSQTRRTHDGSTRPPHHPPPSSRVDINHFDPNGMANLKRTMSNASGAVAGRDPERDTGPAPPMPRPKHNSNSSDSSTVAPGQNSFDFEKTLRDIIQR
jgi:hypothetical protein